MVVINRSCQCLSDDGDVCMLQQYDEVLPTNATDKDRKHYSSYCLVALYTATLFTRGYGFANDTRQIRVRDKINDQSPGRTNIAVVHLFLSAAYAIDAKTLKKEYNATLIKL